MTINERLTSVLLILKIIFWCILIYTAFLGMQFFKHSSETVTTRLDRGEPPFSLDGIASAMGKDSVGKNNGDATFPKFTTTTVKDSEIMSFLNKAQAAAQKNDANGVVQALASLDPVLASKGLTQARETNQQLLKAIQDGDASRTDMLMKQLVQLLS